MPYKLRTLPREWLLSRAERRAARLGREAEERVRREGDWYCERSRQLAHAEAERRRYPNLGHHG